MSAIPLSYKLMIISVIVLRRETVHKTASNRNQWLEAYDYIVVGAGAAGSVVAHRLSENCNNKVLLLEAGGPQSITTDIPKMSRSLLNSEYDWKYSTVPQNWFTPYRIPQARGKGLGGSTSINNMVYNRGNRRDFDNWVTTFGAKGWAFSDLLPYFVNSENNTDDSIVNGSPGFHGTAGPVTISTNPYPDPILLLYQKTLYDYGIPSIDINGKQQLGTAIAQSFIGNGLRSSTANAYLEPNLKPDYLHILTNAYVTKVLFTKINGRLIASGVEFVKNGKKYSVKALREVILSAGAFGSPQILMLSGIGPKNHLKQVGIPLLKDLPVGEYLQDHPTVQIFTLIKNNSLVRTGGRLNVNQLYQLLAQGSGPLSVLTPSILFYSTSSVEDKEWPNTYTYTIVEQISDLDHIVNEMPANREEWKQYFKPYLNRYVLLASPHLTRVRSYGSVRLSSADPYAYPIIDPKFLADGQDLNDLIETIKYVLYLLTETQIAEYVQLFPNAIPGCSYCPNPCPVYECDQYIRCLLRETIKTGYHPVGTCRMGSAKRKDTVVDPNLRVKGVERLRVCDASVMPQIINANTNAASIVIGEKGAELIKNNNYYYNY